MAPAPALDLTTSLRSDLLLWQRHQTQPNWEILMIGTQDQFILILGSLKKEESLQNAPILGCLNWKEGFGNKRSGEGEPGKEGNGLAGCVCGGGGGGG